MVCYHIIIKNITYKENIEMTVRVLKEKLPSTVNSLVFKKNNELTMVISKGSGKNETCSNIYKSVDTGAS